MNLLNDVLSAYGFNEDQQTAIINLIKITAVSDIPEFVDHKDALDWLIKTTQEHWLRGINLERWEVKDNAALAERDKIIEIFHSLDLINEIKPKQTHYDYVLMMGALEERVKTRLEYAHSLHKDGTYNVDDLVILGGARPLMPDQEPSSAHLSPETQTEYHMMMSLLEAMKTQYPEDSFFLKPVQGINTPMQVNPTTGKPCRPNTKDTFDSWLLTRPKPGRVLVISNQPYCSYQHAVALSCLPHDFDVETVGQRYNEQALNVKLVVDSVARALYTGMPAVEKQCKQWAAAQAEPKIPSEMRPSSINSSGFFSNVKQIPHTDERNPESKLSSGSPR